MKSAIKLILAAAVVALSACQKEEASAPSNFPKDGVIRIATNVEIPTTRGGITTDNIRMFSINIKNEVSTKYSYFGIFEKENDVWNCYEDAEKKPLTMLWQNNIQPITVTAVSRDGYPFLKQEFTEITMAVARDQSDEEAFKFSDYLYMAPTKIDPAKAEDLTTDGKIPVTFKHLLSKVNLSITLGTEFNIAPGTTTNPIGNLNINGTTCSFSWEPLVSGMLELTGAKPEAIAPFVGPYTAGNAATATIAATKAVATYEAILVPQTVAEKGFSVSFVIGGKPYTWTSNDAITLEQGKQHTLALTVGKDAVTLSGFTVAEWEVGGEITGGKASASIAYPATHTVHIDKAGELTGELIATAMGAGKDLKITGAMGTADFATLFSWGTVGRTDSDADLLRTLDLTGVTGLTAVPKNAFNLVHSSVALRSLQSISLPTTVTSVEDWAFAGCSSLTSVSAPELQTVEEYAFYKCTSLTEFTATKLLTVGGSAFSDCSSLTSVSAPELQTVEKLVFQRCNSLAKFTAPKLTNIKEYAFFDCSALKELSLTTANNIILTDAFIDFSAHSASCTLHLHKNKDNNGSGKPTANGTTWGGVEWQEITYEGDDSAPTEPDKPGTVHLNGAGTLTADLITTALNGSKSLIITGAMGTADFATLLSWGTEGLKNSDADLLRNLDLTGVTGLTAVPENAFCMVAEGKDVSLRSLQRIDLPSTVTSVGSSAFRNCNSLASVSAPELQTVEAGAFSNCIKLTTFTASKVKTVGALAFSSCESLASFTASKVETVGTSAFGHCKALTEFIATNLHTAGESVFSACYNLKSFSAPGLLTVEEGLFSDCRSLTSLSLPLVPTLGKSAFAGCSNLTSISAPKATAIAATSFSNCTVLTELRLTSAGSIDLDPIAFQYFKAYSCILYLHENKKNGGSGIVTPKVASDGTWDGKKWKDIFYVK